eukprot:3020743-Amphidinium_carterae.1
MSPDGLVPSPGQLCRHPWRQAHDLTKGGNWESMSPEGNMCLCRALGRILQELEHEHGEMDEYRFKEMLLD